MQKSNIYSVIADRSFQRLITKEAENLLGISYNSLRRVVTSLIRERQTEVLLQPDRRSSEEDPLSSYNNAVDQWINIVNIRANKESIRDAAKGTKEAETEASIVQRTTQTTRFLHRNITNSIESLIQHSKSILSNSNYSDSHISESPTLLTPASQLGRKQKQRTEDLPLPSYKDAILKIAQSIVRSAKLSANADATKRLNAKAIKGVELKL